jgi:DNA-binding NarL/FixJ family response regulator
MLKVMPVVCSIREAGSYHEASLIMSSFHPDIVLLDINLPDINGIELLRYIKKKDPSIIVIMVTNQSGEFYRSRCKELGADFFVDKSTEFERLPEILSSLI